MWFYTKRLYIPRDDFSIQIKVFSFWYMKVMPIHTVDRKNKGFKVN